MDGNDQQGTSGGWRLLGLGDSSWCYNGTSVKFPTRLCQALAWYLVLRGGEVRRAQIVEEFWPDAKPEDGLNQLRVTLSRLKSMLASYPDAPTLTSDRSIVSIDIGSIPCVARDYGALLARVESSTGSDERASSLELVRMYSGELLPEFDYQFFVGLRSYYQDRNVHYLGRMSKYLRRTGDFATAVDILQRSLSIDPMQEDLYVMLFGIYAQMDRPLLIEKTVRNLIREMEAKLGDRPTERLEKTIMLALPPRLRERMTATLNAPTVTATSAYAPPVGPFDNPFIPRLSEFTDLHGHVTSGLSRCVAVSGPPGSGKTRLVYEYWLQQQTEVQMTWLDGSKVTSEEELVAQLSACVSRLSPTDNQASSSGIILFDAYQVANPAWRTVVEEFLQTQEGISIIVTTRSSDLPIGWANVPVMTLSAPVATMSDEACLDTQAVQMLFSLMPAAVTSLSETTSTIAYIRTLFNYIDPLPFMIEVVASWLSAMTIQQLILRLSKDRSSLFQAAAERSRDGVVFSETIRAAVQVLSPDGKDVMRLLALYGEPLTKKQIVDVLNLRTDVAFTEVCDSGLVRILEDGKVVVWSLVGEFIRGTQPTSCRNVLRQMVKVGLISATVIETVPNDLVDTVTTITSVKEMSTFITGFNKALSTANVSTCRVVLEKTSHYVVANFLDDLNAHDLSTLCSNYGLVRMFDIYDSIIDRINTTKHKDSQSHNERITQEVRNALLSNSVDASVVARALDHDLKENLGHAISIAIYLSVQRPSQEFTDVAQSICSKLPYVSKGLESGGICLVEGLLFEDRCEYASALNSLQKAKSFIGSGKATNYYAYCIYQEIRIQIARKLFSFETAQMELLPIQSVKEPGIVCGIASQLAFSFTDKRPETALHYLKISNSLYAAHLSNEKTSFATLNRRIELILRDALGDDYIDAHLTSVDASNVSIGDLCGPLDEYVRQTTLFAQG